jgi:hypothetical protein
MAKPSITPAYSTILRPTSTVEQIADRREKSTKKGDKNLNFPLGQVFVQNYLVYRISSCHNNV